MRAFTTLITFIILCLFMSASAIAQDEGIPDSLIAGENGKAFAYPGGKVRVPIYYWSDTPLLGFQIGLEYGLGGEVVTYDSVSTLFSIVAEGYFALAFFVEDGHINGVMSDSIGLGGISIDYEHAGPTGKHKLCDIWFSGLSIGDQMSFDSVFIPPSLENLFSDGYTNWTPQFELGTLDVVEGHSILVTNNPEQVQVNAGELLEFDVSAMGWYQPVTTTFDSLMRLDEYAEPQNQATTFGSNPLTFQWLPNPFEGNSYWRAHFTAVDGAGYDESFSVEIVVLGAGDYYGVIGDCDCSGNIDIDDVVFLMNYVFHGGPTPKCE